MKNGNDAEGPRVLMVGYNGANNTGAEALLQADIEDVRAVLGPSAHITVPTLNEANLRRYLKESPTLEIAPMPSLYFGAVRRMVKDSDLVVLVEGSTYMDTWGSALLWAFLWASACAADLGKPSLAYAVDAGSLSPANRRRVGRIASRTGLIVTRNRAAAERLRGMGVTAPMACTADNAFTFQPRETDQGWHLREWPQARSGVVGMAVVDFTLFPAVVRPWGRRERCYKWPYYFSASPARSRVRDSLARGYAALADHVVESTGKAVALICMEQLDESLAGQVHGLMKHPQGARLFSARRHDASRMTVLLRGLDLLVTSRFHASVLSLAAAVPQVAVGHDTRLSTIYQDLGLREKWFIDPRVQEAIAHGGALDPGIFQGLREKADLLLSNPGQQQQFLRGGYAAHLARARRNRQLLADFVTRNLGACGGGAKARDTLRGASTGGDEWVA